MTYLNLERGKIPTLVNDLNVLLANYQVYAQKLRKFHWNVRGGHFFELHRQFEMMYKDAQNQIDDVAERIQILKYRPFSTLAKYLENAKIKEVDQFFSDTEMVEAIVEDHLILIACMRKVLVKAQKASDEGTVDLVSGLLRNMEKQSWKLSTWLSSPVSTEMMMN